MISLNKGTIENLVVDVEDRTENLTTLDGAGTTFDVRAKWTEDLLITDEPATTDGLKAFCLIDTTSLDEGLYELLISFNNLPEVPILGPVEFEVV